MKITTQQSVITSELATSKSKQPQQIAESKVGFKDDVVTLSSVESQIGSGSKEPPKVYAAPIGSGSKEPPK